MSRMLGVIGRASRDDPALQDVGHCVRYGLQLVPYGGWDVGPVATDAEEGIHPDYDLVAQPLWADAALAACSLCHFLAPPASTSHAAKMSTFPDMPQQQCIDEKITITCK
jgi:hypothetical protein